MCFSATASFTAGSMLSLTGLLSISYSRTMAQRVVAAIPFFFGIQQLAEGMVWRGMEQANDVWIMNGAYIFLFFAFFFWPVWIPFANFMLAKDETRKKIISALLIIGATLGVYLIHNVITNGVLVSMHNSHIRYMVNIPETGQIIGMAAYLGTTVVPFFVVQIPLVNLMGVAIGVSYMVTYIFYTQALISVWCFFAAVISFFAIWLLHDLRKRKL